MNIRVLVTGANGFIGRSLCPALRQAGFEVRGTVRRMAPAETPSDEIATRVVGAVGPETDWSEALAGVDAVVHLAARAHVRRETASDPLAEYRRVNTLGTERLVRQSSALGVRRFIYISSIGVNGNVTLGAPFTEAKAPNPRDPYAVSKWEAEQALRRVAAQTGLEVVVVRPPLVYGPGVKGNFLRLLAVVDRGVPLPLAGIANRRSLLYVGNLVHAIERCLSHPAATGGIFLIRDGDDLSTSDLVRRLAAALGRRALLFPVPGVLLRLAAGGLGRKAAAERLLGSLTVDDAPLRRELAWQPLFTVERGLAETAAWYKRRSD